MFNLYHMAIGEFSVSVDELRKTLDKKRFMLGKTMSPFDRAVIKTEILAIQDEIRRIRKKASYEKQKQKIIELKK